MRLPALSNFQFEIRSFQSNFKNLIIKNSLKIFLLLLVASCYLLFAIPSYAQAIDQTPQNSYTAPNTNPDVPKNLHTYSQNVLIEVMAAVTCQLAGVDPTSPSQKCLGVDTDTGKIGYTETGGGAIGFMGNMITMLYTPPAHTGDYIQNIAQNFGIAKSANAYRLCRFGSCYNLPSQPVQPTTSGTGFAGLSPLLKTWQTFRDFVYLAFVVVFIFIGVAIMLRVKIDPRTVMTIQNQIPKLIIGILLVTFSFAIAGFLIDVMWIVIYLSYGVFNSISGVDVTSLNPQNMVGATPMGAVGFFGDGGIGGMAMNGAGSIKNVITGLFDNTWGRLIAGAIGGVVGTGASGAAGTVSKIFKLGASGAGAANPVAIALGVGGAIAGVTAGLIAGSKLLGVVGGLIAFLIIAIALLWALIRLWLTLLIAYIMILMSIVLAPFWIIAGLFPGSAISFSSWARDLIANLAAFPATIIMFLLGKTFIDAFATSAPGQQFVPPLVGNPGDVKSFGALIGLGIILTTPNIVKMLKEALKAPKFDLSSAGQTIGVGAGYPISVGKGVGQTMSGKSEIIMRKQPGGGYDWGERGIGRSFFGRFFR